MLKKLKELFRNEDFRGKLQLNEQNNGGKFEGRFNPCDFSLCPL